MPEKFIGLTTSNEVRINPSSVHYLEKTLKAVKPTNLKMRFRRDGEDLWFSIHGPEIFLLYDEDSEEVTEKIVEQISTHLLPGEEMYIQSIGYEGMTYPFIMFEWRIYQDKNAEYIVLRDFTTSYPKVS